ncbi:MAG: HAD family phosphatase [Flavobacteriia bacterium]|nr:HAD family phosphatase [Flavobacteriia bacterium]
MKESYQAILFDLGGVLIDIDYLATEKAFEQLGVSDFKSRYTQFAQNEVFDRFECGEISPQHFLNLLLPETKIGTSPNQVVAAWNAMIGDFPLEKLALLVKLKTAQVPLFLLSNTNALHIVEVVKSLQKVSDLGLNTYFEEVFLSHEIGKRKPHPETFLWTCKQIGFAPKDVLFIDDSPQHIEGAQAAGLPTYFYQNESDFYAFFS